MQKAFGLAKEWLLQSGIQDLRKDSGNYGSFADWLDLNSGKYNAAYPEITGYGIQALLFLNSLESEPALIKRAESAAEWLFSKAAIDLKGGTAFLDKVPHGKAAGGQIAYYAFDAGMALEGLLSLYLQIRDEELLAKAGRVAAWLRSLVDAGGGMKPYESKEQLQSKWSSQKGAFHAKVAMAMHRFGEITDDAGMRKSAHSICGFALKKQTYGGRFITDMNDQSTYTHAHCYTVEGLLSLGMRGGKEEYAAAALRGAEWLRKAQLPTGGISRKFVAGKFVQDEGADILSQAIRIWKIAGGVGKDGYEKELERGLQRLESFQIKNGGKSGKGGFMYGFKDGELVKNVNSWATMFALQALWLSEGDNNEKFGVDLLI